MKALNFFLIDGRWKAGVYGLIVLLGAAQIFEWEPRGVLAIAAVFCCIITVVFNVFLKDKLEGNLRNLFITILSIQMFTSATVVLLALLNIMFSRG